jgi:hypothetical protein
MDQVCSVVCMVLQLLLVTVLQADLTKLSESLHQWKNAIGEGQQSQPLTLSISDKTKMPNSNVVTPATGPKVGIKDPSNEPHSGGSSFQGGSGGRDTAGL